MHDLSISKDNLKKIKIKLENNKIFIISSEEATIKYNLSIVLIDKLIQIIDELSESNTDLHKHVATLRYIFETLVVTKLLIKENDYFVKIYFSIYKHKENKTKLMIRKLEDELKVLKEYFHQYLNEKKDNSLKYSTDLLKLAEENEKTFQAFKKILEENINISYSQIEDFGFDYLIYNLENKFLLNYKLKLKKIEETRDEKSRQLCKAEWFKKYFSNGKIIQHTQVFKLLEDHRSWQQKTKDIGLYEEYCLNYEMTSSLLHFTSYSLFRAKKIQENDIKYNYMLINQYIKNITQNISTFLFR